MSVLQDIVSSTLLGLKTLKEQAISTEAFCTPPDLTGGGPAEEAESDDDSKTVGLSQLDSADIQLVDVPGLQLSPQETVLRDKLGFFLGLVNLVFSTYWLGCSPQTWSNWYTFKASILFTVRFFLYRRRKWGFYLIEFCYWANLLLLIKIWIFPNSRLLNMVVFGLCAGPITFSIPALRNSLVLHSLDKTTSLFMHATPAVMAWCLRWHPYKQVEDVTRGRWWFRLVGPIQDVQADPEYWELILYPFLAYALWALAYYIEVFVFSSNKIFHQNYSNMYTLMVTNSKSGAAKLVLKAPAKLQPAVYLLLHCLLCSFTISLAAVFWYHKTLHTAVLIACCASSAWNGAVYFFDIFAHRYVESVGVAKNAKKD